MSDRVSAKIIHHATSALCKNSGSMKFPQLYRTVCERFDMTQDEFYNVLSNCSRFVIASKHWERTDDWETHTVVAKTSLRLCKNYADKTACSLSCKELHLCRDFVYGNCRYQKYVNGVAPCEFSHDLRSEHNDYVLRECTLHKLLKAELFLLLLQNDPTLLPGLCNHYNMGHGPHGICGFRETCHKLHLCGDFVHGMACATPCSRLHTMTHIGRGTLERWGIRMGRQLYQNLPFIYQNIYQLTKASEAHDAHNGHVGETFSRPGKRQREDDQTQEICLYYLLRNCRYKEKCVRVHSNLPYKWELFERGEWRDLRHMEKIERDYCDPCNTHSLGSKTIDFLTMSRGLDPVRRLSTISSQTNLPNLGSSLSHLTTEWVWYYKGDTKNWIEYGQPEEDTQHTTTVSSRQLEEMYLADPTAEVTVMKGHRYYFVSFQDMYQRNPKHNTKRSVRRRPRFHACCFY